MTKRSRTPSWGIAGRDLIWLAALLVVIAIPISLEIARNAAPGPSARAAIGWEHVTRRALSEGVPPLWNPYQFGGRPHLADAETLSLYPPHALLRFLPLPLFFSVSFALHAWVAGAGTYLAARRLGAPPVASMAASGAVLCGGLFAPLGEMAYSRDVYRLAWLPLVAACALRSAERRTWVPHPELVVVVTLALIASALRPAYLLATVIACYLFAAIWSAVPGSRRPHLLVQPLMLALLAAGSSAVQAVPAVRLATTMRGAGDLLRDVPPRAHHAGSAWQDPGLAEVLYFFSAGGRVLSVCDGSIGNSDAVALGRPGVGGHGGVVLADYARFSNLVRGRQEPVRPVFDGIPEAVDGPARLDLLRLLAVEYLVSCTPPDPQRWAPVSERAGIGIHRSLDPAPRAFWTCSPLPVGRQEMKHRLQRSRYDSRVVLQPHLTIHVRWRAGLPDRDRASLESEHHLEPLRDVGDRTWEYNLLDRSRENVAAIVSHPLAEDTHGIDRGTLLLTATPEPIPAFDEPESEWLMGGDECDHAPIPVIVRSQDRLDGAMTVDVTAPEDGMVFFSETYYRDRRAWVDGQRVPRMKVNLAFTGVPVPAGAHRIELRYDAGSLWWGAGLSLSTLGVWLLAERRVRRSPGVRRQQSAQRHADR